MVINYARHGTLRRPWNPLYDEVGNQLDKLTSEKGIENPTLEPISEKCEDSKENITDVYETETPL